MLADTYLSWTMIEPWTAILVADSDCRLAFWSSSCARDSWASWQITYRGIHLADVPGANMSSPWHFTQKVPVIFVMFLGQGERRAEACSGDNMGEQTTFFNKSNLADADLLSRGVCSGADKRGSV